MSKEQAEEAYKDFLSDIPLFTYAMQCVIKEWPNSCDQFLSNSNMNRIAWLGQASMCLCTGVSSKFRGGFRLLSEDQQLKANQAAENVLTKWLRDNGEV